MVNYNEICNILKNESKKHGWGLILIARDQLKRIIQNKKPKILLDIGCHNRLLEKTIQEWLNEVCSKVYTIGLDIVKYEVSPEVIASGDYLPFRYNSVEFITLIETLEHIPDYVRCLKECLKVLKSGGGIFIQSVCCLSPHAFEGDQTHYHVLHPETLTRLLSLLGYKVVEKGMVNLTFYLYAEKP